MKERFIRFIKSDMVLIRERSSFSQEYRQNVCYCGSPSLAGTVDIVDLTEETGVQVTRYSF